MDNQGQAKGTLRLWQTGFHPEQVHSAEFIRQKVVYIHHNPVSAGFVSDPCAWTNSSAACHERGAAPPIPVTVLDA